MSAKPRPKVPRSARWKSAGRRWFRATLRDLRELREEHAEVSGRGVKPGSKLRPGGATKTRVNPWPRCASCHRRRLASEFDCEEPDHADLCNSCCGCSGGRRGGGGGSGCSCSGRCDCQERDDELDEDEGDEPDEQEPGPHEDGGDSSDDHHRAPGRWRG
jgi:hypothetical protein